jgi:hypothetical protein
MVKNLGQKSMTGYNGRVVVAKREKKWRKKQKKYKPFQTPS